MRSQNFGIEIEMTGITRSTAARVIAGYFNTTATHVGGTYDAYTVRDGDDRQWKVVSDASLRCTDRNGRGASKLYSVEFVSPICHYEDIETPIIEQSIGSKGNVIIGEGSWLGNNVAVISCKIGKHCVIGANSVVTHDIPDYSVAVGCPARVIKRYIPAGRSLITWSILRLILNL